LSKDRLYRIWPQIVDAMVLVKPVTVVEWHRKGFRLLWRWRSRGPGRPITEVITAPRSPWQNPYAERLIGSIRRECLDHVIILNERHLRRVLSSYFQYHHDAKTHLSLHKDCPRPRAVQLPFTGDNIVAFPGLAACIIAMSVELRKMGEVARCCLYRPSLVPN